MKRRGGKEQASLRVFSGAFKGRKLIAPADIRPTEGIVRQAIFNILRDWVPGARVLDAFAGSGALGIEALSNGAEHATFVDCSGDSVMAIRDNLEHLGLDLPSSAWRVMQSEFGAAAAFLAGRERPFDLVLLDPPYKTDDAPRALQTLASCAILSAHAVVAVEHHRETVLPAGIQDIQRVKEHRYGSTVLSLYQRAAE